VVDVDYYSSTVDVLKVFEAEAKCYLPTTIVYLDDIWLDENNSFCGEWLAVNEFNSAHPYRKIEHSPFLLHKRLFRRPKWIRQVYQLHVFDHPKRWDVKQREAQRKHENPYLH
jgi:hypothetical protein